MDILLFDKTQKVVQLIDVAVPLENLPSEVP
jgi:hypothetical protein